jgi:hypothetical protein
MPVPGAGRNRTRAWIRSSIRNRQINGFAMERSFKRRRGPAGAWGAYRRRITAASSQEIARYITDETMARMVIPVITMFILKIWLPY